MSAAQQPIKFWTYSIINYDLLADDLESAASISPTVIWTSREKAMSSLAVELNEFLADVNEEDKIDLEIVWKDEETHMVKGHYGEDVPMTTVEGKCEVLGVEVCLYEVRVED